MEARGGKIGKIQCLNSYKEGNLDNLQQQKLCLYDASSSCCHFRAKEVTTWKHIAEVFQLCTA